MKSRSQPWRAGGLRKARSGEANWAVSYVDVLTLLLCFFIVFYSAGDQDNKKADVLNVIVGQFGGETDAPMTQASADRAPASEAKAPVAEPTKQETWVKSLSVVLDSNENVEMKTESETVYVSFRTVEFFAPGSTDLTANGRAIVEKFAKVMLAHRDQVRVAVQGHTDGQQVSPGRHQYKDNWELSVLRATRVLSLMISKGFDSSALSAEGYADTRAVASDDLHPRRISFRIEPRLPSVEEKGEVKK